ncbi:phosphatase PAP2 family protein [Blastococcus sp. CT_GayMR16]|uniref:phosphatase PAP2 family protein n=1 Tax=Blastococcus sp. CT_GayMR16 TaxID=2559607 RepID=UPI001072F23A|nr:phosphatase PAP2 family protein [Blastococcus sp. CT_GayMR16]TFV91092.1 phosphatase PAP2 family protein [Blastococcus sp. CT_GayMR16]
MNVLIVATAQYLLYVLAAIAGLVWLTRPRTDKIMLAAQSLVGLALVGVGIWVAGALHVDPRPFVHDPSSAALFAHAADNGFPSDHSAAGGLLAALLFPYRRLVGVAIGAGAVLIGVARIAAHVHHSQDVIAGLGIGLSAGVLAVIGVRWLAGVRSRRMSTFV